MQKTTLKPLKRSFGLSSEHNHFVGKRIFVTGTRLAPCELLYSLVCNVERKFANVSDFCERFGVTKNTYYAVIKSVRSKKLTDKSYASLVSMSDFSKRYTTKSLLVLNNKQAVLLKYSLLADYGTLGSASLSLGVDYRILGKLLGNSARALNKKSPDKANCVSLYTQLVELGYIKIVI